MLQNARQESTRSLIERPITKASADDSNGKLHISNSAVDDEKLLASLRKRIIVGMDVQDCTGTLAGLIERSSQDDLHAYFLSKVTSHHSLMSVPSTRLLI